MNTKQSVLLTAVAAFAGGFLTALLVAPQSGRDARRRIAEQARHSSRWLDQQLHRVEAQLNRLEDQLGETRSQLGDRIKAATQSAVDQVVPSVPEEDEEWGVEREDLAHNLRRIPRQ